MKTQLVFLAVVVLAGSALAAGLSWKGAGATARWDDPDNYWSSAVPVAADYLIMQSRDSGDPENPWWQYCLIEEGLDAVIDSIHHWSDSPDGIPETINVTGGTLTVNLWNLTTNSPCPSSRDYCEANVSGGVATVGTLSLGGSLPTGTGVHGTINISGSGEVIVTDSLSVGVHALADAIGYVNLSGDGTLTTANMSILADYGFVHITDNAVLTITKDALADVQTWVGAGSLTVASGFYIDATIDGSGYTVVRSLEMDMSKARDPNPANWATGVVNSNVPLSWTAGDDAVSHNVLVGTASDALVQVATEIGVTNFTYTPAVLDLDTTYYWRIDEVGTSVAQGDVWAFTTTGYVPIEDFEVYDESGNEIWRTWSRGQDTWDSGSTVSLTADANFVHGGAQAMRLGYDNRAGSWWPLFSETTRTINADFAASGVKGIDIWIMGNEGNAEDNLYVRLNDGSSSETVYLQTFNGNDIDILLPEWQVARIDLAMLGLTLSNIETITIGIGDADNPVASGMGTIYVDDIALYLTRCLGGNPPGDSNGDCKVNFLDLTDEMDNWLEDGLWP